MNLLHFILDTNRARAEAIRRECDNRDNDGHCPRCDAVILAGRMRHHLTWCDGIGLNDNPTSEQPEPAQQAAQEVEL